MAPCSQLCIFFFLNAMKELLVWGFDKESNVPIHLWKLIKLDKPGYTAEDAGKYISLSPHGNKNLPTVEHCLLFCGLGSWYRTVGPFVGDAHRNWGGAWVERLILRVLQVCGRRWCTMCECLENIYRNVPAGFSGMPSYAREPSLIISLQIFCPCPLRFFCLWLFSLC